MRCSRGIYRDSAISDDVALWLVNPSMTTVRLRALRRSMAIVVAAQIAWCAGFANQADASVPYTKLDMVARSATPFYLSFLYAAGRNREGAEVARGLAYACEPNPDFDIVDDCGRSNTWAALFHAQLRQLTTARYFYLRARPRLITLGVHPKHIFILEIYDWAKRTVMDEAEYKPPKEIARIRTWDVSVAIVATVAFPPAPDVHQPTQTASTVMSWRHGHGDEGKRQRRTLQKAKPQSVHVRVAVEPLCSLPDWACRIFKTSVR